MQYEVVDSNNLQLRHIHNSWPAVVTDTDRDGEWLVNCSVIAVSAHCCLSADNTDVDRNTIGFANLLLYSFVPRDVRPLQTGLSRSKAHEVSHTLETFVCLSRTSFILNLGRPSPTAASATRMRHLCSSPQALQLPQPWNNKTRTIANSHAAEVKVWM